MTNVSCALLGTSIQMLGLHFEICHNSCHKFSYFCNQYCKSSTCLMQYHKSKEMLKFYVLLTASRYIHLKKNQLDARFIFSIFRQIGFGGLGVACWPLVPKFAGSNPAEAVGILGRKNPQHAFLRRGSKAVSPML